MKLRKICAVCLSIVLLLMSLPTAAASFEIDIVANGSFETSGSWANTSGASISTGGYANRGNAALKMELESDKENCYSSQTLNNLIPNETYTLTFFISVLEESESAYSAIKFEVKDKEGKIIKNITLTGFNSRIGKWRKYTRKIQMPEGADSAALLLRWYGQGKVYYDDVSFTIPTESFEKNASQTEQTLPEPYGDAGELYQNGGFEELDENGLPSGGVTAYQAWQDGFVSVTDKEVHSGKHAIKISTDAGGNPWVRQLVPISPKTEYVLSSYMKTVGVTGIVRKKLEFYTEMDVSSETSVKGTDFTSPNMNYVEGQWMPYTFTFTAPEGAYCVAVYSRLYGQGTLYVDDLTCYAISETPVMTMESDQEFYYTEWGGNVTITATADTKSYPELLGGQIRFELYEEETLLSVIGEEKVSGDKTSVSFPLAKLEKEKTEYIVKATAVGTDGQEKTPATKSVFRYNRPTMINDKNELIVDGESFIPKYWYHGSATVEGMRRQKEYGANTFIITGNNMATPNTVLTLLDRCEAEGLKAIIATYVNKLPGGHPENAENTRKVVPLVKDHPALLGYLAADEPMTQTGVGYEQYLSDTYRLIRDIDPVHPVITNEASPSAFVKVAKRSDILTHDPYIGDNPRSFSPVNHVSQRMAQTRDAAEAAGGKPYFAVIGAFYWGVDVNKGVYFPTADEVRHQVYQGLLEGSTGIGLYSFVDAATNIGGAKVPLNETPMGPGLKKFASFEFNEAIDFFIYNKYPEFASGKNEKYEYHSWVHDGNIYMILLDLDASFTARPGYEISIPLTSQNGKVKIGKFTAEIIAGGDEPIQTGNGELSHWLTYRQAAFYKITPAAPIDVALLKG